LKRFATADTHQQVQVRTYVGEVIDPNVETARHGAEDLTHGTFMLAEVPFAACVVTAQHDVHRPPSADRSLKLAPSPAHRPAVLSSREFGSQIPREEWSLHQLNVTA
jgi:hypothetical protein